MAIGHFHAGAHGQAHRGADCIRQAHHSGNCADGYLEIEIHPGLTEQTLVALIHHRPAIRFDKLTRITPAIAKALAQRRLKHLCEGLDGDPEEASQAIADDHPWLYLDHLTQLTTECARELAKHPGPISLKGLLHLDVDVAQVFSRRKDAVYLGKE